LKQALAERFAKASNRFKPTAVRFGKLQTVMSTIVNFGSGNPNQWETWKKQARQYELELDSQLVTFSQLTNRTQSSLTVQHNIEAQQSQIDELLKKVGVCCIGKED
jgi:transposase-like protein